MAHSLRSKSKLKSKSLKRKSVFQKYDDEKRKQISEKLKENIEKQQKVKEYGNDGNRDEDMVVEHPEEKKISTSGWRDARHLNYKKINKKFKLNRTHFKK
ncbi:uncharacterized protein ASCRUDRAFT_7034 [Ascoidea rubescens DSM 1968]|uniref:DUF2423 domain-containing protein n=1 Tax=Ascoidea rubescens DSM 1968 TaxID=1344418 RepID=A0A1D2VLK9_9ASCO|nr:hypothetical protein ASCRUDRAFT_7034 [Ascoidea rubescens DSM 1968]ODV62464.1 hypothetical protein ASCRUDRAFT_7034 [Ascoidea rubescens DSM 1968]